MKKMCEDDQLASMMDSSKVPSKPTFRCPSKKLVKEMCCNKNCDSSLHCTDKDCGPCSKHLLCSTKSLSKVSSVINDLSKYRKDVLEDIKRVDKEANKLLTDSLGEFIEEYFEHCLEEENMPIF